MRKMSYLSHTHRWIIGGLGYVYCQLLPAVAPKHYAFAAVVSSIVTDFPSEMATGKDLIDAVRTSLEADGELGQIKAEMRTKVMKLLEGSQRSSRSKRPKAPHEVLIINELIREYLDWMGYKYSSTILVSECELSKQPLDRTFITNDLGAVETEKTKDLPLLLSIVETFKEMKGL